MLENPNSMPELKKKKSVSMKQKPLPKYKSAAQTFFTRQKTSKRRK